MPLLPRELDNLAFADARSCSAWSFSRRQSTSLYSHCFRVAPVEFLISYSSLCFSAARALCFAFHSVCNKAYSAFVFAGSGVADGEAATAYALEGSAFADASACCFFRRQSASLYFHCSLVAPVEFAISYWSLCFSPARPLPLAFHSVSNRALAFAGSGVADGEG